MSMATTQCSFHGYVCYLWWGETGHPEGRVDQRDLSFQQHLHIVSCARVDWRYSWFCHFLWNVGLPQQKTKSSSVARNWEMKKKSKCLIVGEVDYDSADLKQPQSLERQHFSFFLNSSMVSTCWGLTPGWENHQLYLLQAHLAESNRPVIDSDNWG